jgi:uncharacterized protein YlzI (FlbEa/FlbD family)
LIKTCEASPDTMITLINGEKLIVREELKQLTLRVQNYRAKLLAAAAEEMPGRNAAGTIELCASLESGERTEQATRAAQDSFCRDH